MTRKQAITKAIKILSYDDDNKEIVLKLKEIEEEMPLSFWTKASILDAIITYASEHNNTLPVISELISKNNLPSRTVIESKYNISSIDTFYKKYLPELTPQNKSSSPYRYKNNDFFIDVFKTNYIRIKNKKNVKYISMKLYDKYKKRNTPTISTIIRKCGFNSYEDLLISCEFKKRTVPLVCTTNISYNDGDNVDEELIKIVNLITSQKK